MSNRMYAYRPPTVEEVRASHILATRLGNAQVRARHKVIRHDQKPGGKISHRRAMKYEAQEAAGAAPTARPFGHTVWRREIDPPLRVGFIQDVSSSMNSLAATGSTFSWVLRAACRRIDAQIAGTWFGHSGYGPLIKDAKVPANVAQVPCYGNTAGGPDALTLLDAALNLSGNSEGVRVLFVLTDGGLNHERAYEFGDYLDALAEDGVIVVWVQGSGDNEPRYMGKRHRVIQLDTWTGNITTQITQFADLVVKELQAA